MSAGANGPNAETVIALLGLTWHPEGGLFRETFRDSDSTAIYYHLLKAGEVSHWHRIDKSELWHWHGGAALDFPCRATARMSSAMWWAPISPAASGRNSRCRPAPGNRHAASAPGA